MPAEREPDYRVTLANERTFLAWARTTMGLLAGSVAITQLVDTIPVWLRVTVGGVLAALALAVAITGFTTWQRREHAIRRDLPIVRRGLIVGVTVVLVVFTTLVSLIVITSTR